jgi:hypothetical protein
MKKILLPVAGVALLAACSSSPSTTSGTETAHGSISGASALSNSAKFHLTWTGPVNTTGQFSTGGAPPKEGQSHTFKTAAGNLNVKVSAKPVNKQSSNSATCKIAFATTVPYTVTGGTGKFEGATGSGKVVVSFNGTLPKKNDGKCNMSQQAQPVSGAATATLSGPLTVKS